MLTFGTGLMSPEVRPQWAGIKFWRVALTVRYVPANRPMWELETTDEIVRAGGIRHKEVGRIGFDDPVRPGTVVVMATGGAGEVDFRVRRTASGWSPPERLGSSRHLRESCVLPTGRTKRSDTLTEPQTSIS